MKIHSLANKSADRAFTFIEVLAVLGILAILVTGATPPILATVKSSRLTAAADQVLGALNEAQGLAITFSTEVEARFFEAPDSGRDPGLERDSIQIFRLADADAPFNPRDAFEPASARQSLPEGISFSRVEKFSSLRRTRPKSEPDNGSTPAAAVIRFLPDGSTQLDGTGLWFLSLVEERMRDVETLPSNFATIQLDPATGRLELHRPN